jgi:hypothetical protein
MRSGFLGDSGLVREEIIRKGRISAENFLGRHRDIFRNGKARKKIARESTSGADQ